jgi:hypothetical protein
VIIEEYKSSFSLGALGTNALFSFIPSEYTLGSGTKVATWQIGGATAAFDAINFGIKAMNPEIIKAGLSIATDSVDADVVATWFLESVKNKMANARLSYMLSAMFAALAYKCRDYSAPMLNELTSKMIGSWLNTYGFLSLDIFKISNNPNGTTIQNASKQNITLKDGFTYLPTGMLALNTVKSYSDTEVLRAAIVDVANTLITSDKIGLAQRPDLITAIENACASSLVDSLTTRWSAKKALTKTINSVVKSNKLVKVA